MVEEHVECNMCSAIKFNSVRYDLSLGNRYFDLLRQIYLGHCLTTASIDLSKILDLLFNIHGKHLRSC